MSDAIDYPGCTDGGCVYGHPGGMHTNGGCRCLRDVHRALGPKRHAEIERAIRAARRRAMLTLLDEQQTCEESIRRTSDGDWLGQTTEGEWVPLTHDKLLVWLGLSYDRA